MKKRTLLGLTALVMSFACVSHAAVIVDVNFNDLSAGSTISDGVRIQDVSGNGYHGFWGGTGGDTSIISTPWGRGIDNSTSTAANPGYIFLRDGLTGIPDAWDGGTTSTTPYFTLDGGATGAWTIETRINWNNTADNSGGLFGQTGGNQIWARERDGTFTAIIGASDAIVVNVDVSAAKADGGWHTLALVYDGAAGEVRTFVDGVLADTNTDADIGALPTLLDGTGDFRLGSYNGSSTEDFQGQMDTFRISDTALTTGEMLAIPEPATLGMVMAFGGGMLFIRRKLMM